MNMKILSTEKHYDEALFSDDNVDAGDTEDVAAQVISPGAKPERFKEENVGRKIEYEQSSPFFQRQDKVPRFEKQATSEDIVLDLARSGYRRFSFEEDSPAFA